MNDEDFGPASECPACGERSRLYLAACRCKACGFRATFKRATARDFSEIDMDRLARLVPELFARSSLEEGNDDDE